MTTRQQKVQTYKKWRMAGKCIRCGAVAEEGRSRCTGCAERERAKYASLPEEQKVAYRAQQEQKRRSLSREGKDALNTRKRAQRDALRLEVLHAYGGVCACCGESEVAFLCIDHVHGGGNKHRRELKESGRSGSLYYWLRSTGYPEGFQVLCHNCNFAKGYNGVCPHQKQSEGGLE